MERVTELIRFLTDTRLYLSTDARNCKEASRPAHRTANRANIPDHPDPREWDPFQVWRRHIRDS